MTLHLEPYNELSRRIFFRVSGDSELSRTMAAARGVGQARCLDKIAAEGHVVAVATRILAFI